MKFGIFYEHQLPRPWNEDSEYELLQDALEQSSSPTASGIAVRAGRSSTTSSRSTATRARPRCSSPPSSQRTKNIRLGHGIVQTPPPFNHPARIAERISMLDLVSSGRVDFGTGESSSEAELGGFLIDPIGEARDVGRGLARRASGA